jgi:hypothetical protein
MPYEYKKHGIPQNEHDAINKIIKHDLKMEEILQRPGTLIGTDPQLKDLGLEKDLQSNQYIDKPVPPSAQSKIDIDIEEVKKILDEKHVERKEKINKLNSLKKNDENRQEIINLLTEIRKLEEYMMDLNEKIAN